MACDQLQGSWRPHMASTDTALTRTHTNFFKEEMLKQVTAPGEERKRASEAINTWNLQTLFFFTLKVLFLCVGVLSSCMYVHRAEKKVLSLLELELQMAVICHVCAGNQT